MSLSGVLKTTAGPRSPTTEPPHPWALRSTVRPPIPLYYSTAAGAPLFKVVRDDEPGPEIYMAFESMKFKKKPTHIKTLHDTLASEVTNSLMAENSHDSSPIQVTSFVADSDSAVSMKDLQHLALSEPKLVNGSPPDTISAFFITAADDYRAEPTAENQQHTILARPNQAVVSIPNYATPLPPEIQTFRPLPETNTILGEEETTTFRPIVVKEEYESTTTDGFTNPTATPVPEAQRSKVKVNGDSGLVRRERYSSTAPPEEQVVTVTPLPKSASLLTSAHSVLAPIQAALSLSSQDKRPPVLEQQVIHKQPVYKTFIEIQKSIPLDIKDLESSSGPVEELVLPPVRMSPQPPVQQHGLPQQHGLLQQNGLPQQNGLLQQVMLAYQTLSNHNYALPQGPLAEPPVAPPPPRPTPPHGPNLYYVPRNKYLQPQQLVYYVPYASPNYHGGNKGYVGSYIMQHSHENTGTEQYLRTPSFPYVFQNPFQGLQGLQGLPAPLVLDHIPLQLLQSNLYPQNSKEEAPSGGTRYIVQHDTGATSGSFFKMEGTDNNIEESEGDTEHPREEHERNREEDSNPEAAVAVEQSAVHLQPQQAQAAESVQLPSPGNKPLFQYTPPPYGGLPPGFHFYQHMPSGKQSGSARSAFRPSQSVFSSQYPPPQTYRVVSAVMRGRGMRSIGRGKKLCIEYGGFKPPLIPSVQIDEKFLDKQEAEEKSAKEE